MRLWEDAGLGQEVDTLLRFFWGASVEEMALGVTVQPTNFVLHSASELQARERKMS